MEFAGRLRENLFATLGLFVFAATLTAVSAGGAFVWFVLALLDGGPVAEAFGTLLPIFVLGVLVGIPLAAVSLLGVSYGLVLRASAALESAITDLQSNAATWIGRTVRKVERESALVRLFDLSPMIDAIDPRSPEARAEDRIAQVKRRYVDGSLSEFEFERRIRDVLDDERVSRDAVSSLDARLGERGREREL